VHERSLAVLTLLAKRYRARRDDERGFTIIEVTIASSIMVTVLAMFFSTLVSLTKSEDRSQRLVSNEQNVRFELDQLAREVRAANPLVPLPQAWPVTNYSSTIELVLGPTGGTQQVVRWSYDTVKEEMVRQLMSSTADTATVVSQSFYLNRVRNVEVGVPIFTYYNDQGQDLVAQVVANGSSGNNVTECAMRVHIVLMSDSNPGPVPFSETQDVELRNRIPGSGGSNNPCDAT
jgi:type II secretory pathway pseudopilin PulG